MSLGSHFVCRFGKKKKEKGETRRKGTTQLTSNWARDTETELATRSEASEAGEGEIKKEKGPVTSDGRGINIEFLSC